MSCKLFVANFPYSTTNEELNTLFGPHGQVLSVKIATDRETGRSRGFGFVEMGSEQEADNAIRELDGYQLAGAAWPCAWPRSVRARAVPAARAAARAARAGRAPTAAARCGGFGGPRRWRFRRSARPARRHGRSGRAASAGARAARDPARATELIPFAASFGAGRAPGPALRSGRLGSLTGQGPLPT